MAQRGIQSVEVGGRLLLALADGGGAMALKDLAQAAGMAPAKAHPYLVSFGKLGLVMQDAASGRYALGPLAMQLGLISLQQSDPLRLATQQLPALAQAVGQTVAIAVWGHRGATIVRVEHPPTLVHVNLRHGTVMSLRGTASGRLFAAYLPREPVLAAAGQESWGSGFERELAAIRKQGLSHAVDASVPGVSALAAPVFDGSGQLSLCLTAIGVGASFDVGPQGAPATALKACAAGLSAQLGATKN